MKRLLLVVLLMVLFIPTSSASADYRWAPPTAEKRTVITKCSTLECLRVTFRKEEKRIVRKIRAHNKRRLAEWNRTIRIFIPRCTWFGESGEGPEFAPYRYTLPNATGSGALGKYQFMPKTYRSVAKYGDWSPLDQEIAARREYGKNGISPWSNCTS